MGGRNASPRPAEPGLANTRRHQRKPAYDSATEVNNRKSEKDVAKLIDCLSEWTRDLRAARDAAPEAPPRRSRSPGRTQRAASSAFSAPLFPRGNPLTESMELTDRDGRGWLVYIEGGQVSDPGRQRRAATVLPDRHLRFDSASESRFTALVPAGSPFLAAARLQSLLDEAMGDLPSGGTNGSATDASFSLARRVVEWSTRAVESGHEVLAESARRLLELRSAATLLLRHRPARP
jgi:hypothetical protein